LHELQSCVDCKIVPIDGLRERKKLDTYRAIAHAARQLVQQRGLDAVTVDQIAEAAGISTRTFFNYFPCKEDAVVGIDPAILTDLADEVRRRPTGEEPIAALRAVLIGRTAPDASLQRWQLRNELVARHPDLLPRHLSAMAGVEAALTGALAERAGTDPRRDPRIAMLVAAALAAVRAGIAWWERSDRSQPLPAVLDAAFDLLAPLH
jgi:AcrR family transcriptional regulator